MYATVAKEASNVSNVNYWAVVVSVVVVFILSSVYYSVSSKQLAAFTKTDPNAAMPVWKIPLELLRSFVVAYVLARLFALVGGLGVLGAVSVALLLWVGFPVVLLTGSMLHEGVPWQLAALHAGDWLIKLVVITVILGLWH